MDVIINGIKYMPERKVTKKKRPFSVLLRETRKLSGETLEKAAKSLGVTKSYIWELEKGGAAPGLGVVQKAIKHYGITFDEIEDI